MLQFLPLHSHDEEDEDVGKTQPCTPPHTRSIRKDGVADAQEAVAGLFPSL